MAESGYQCNLQVIPLKGRGAALLISVLFLSSCWLECGCNSDQLEPNGKHPVKGRNNKVKRIEFLLTWWSGAAWPALTLMWEKNQFLSFISPCYFQSLKHEAKPVSITVQRPALPGLLTGQGSFCPQRTFGKIRRQFWLSRLRAQRLLLTSSEWRPEMLLSSRQCIKQPLPPTRKDDAAPDYKAPKH